MITPQSQQIAPAVPLTNAQQIAGMIEQLQEALKTQSPMYESLLHKIHVELHKDEEVAVLLTEEQVAVVIAGLAKKTNVVIAAVEKKGTSASGGKKLKDISVGDL